MLTLLIVPLSLMVPTKADQPAALFTLLFCCSTNPVEGEGQETITLVPDRVMVRLGAPGVCATEMRDQNPPVREKLPPLITGPASGWPMVPLTEYTPPVLVPPPPSIVNQSIEYCPKAGKQKVESRKQKRRCGL